VEALAGARERGWRVSGEATPHHLLLTEEDVRRLDTRMKMNPPLATEEDRLALVEGLRSGVVECVATDHAPHARDEKEVPFEQAPMGTTGLETAFAALHGGLVIPGLIPLEVLIERMSAGAPLFGLAAPRIAAGEAASVVLLDLEAEWTAGEHGWESRSENCCFSGRRLRGAVLLTLADGSIVHRARVLAAAGVS
jgi:dihydroorotase